MLNSSKKFSLKSIFILFLFVFGMLFVDQFTKSLAIESFQDQQFEVIKGVFRLTYSENTGVAFSIPIPEKLIFILNTILLVLISYVAKKELNLKKKSAQIFLALILVGGLSNIIDRIRYGFVVDFISIWIYPIFNMADVYISVGVLLTIVFYGKIKRLKK